MPQVANNVQCVLSAVAPADTSITISDPTAPLNLPATPTTYGIATLVDSLYNPTLVEVIHYTGLTDNGNGTHTLTGVTRGQESTTAQTFAAGFLIQAPTAGLMDAKANSADLGTAATTDASAYATAAQGNTADTAVQPGDFTNTLGEIDDATDAVQLAKAEEATDTTAGRLLKVGDFGLGSVANPPQFADANTATPYSGFIRFPNTATNTPVSGGFFNGVQIGPASFNTQLVSRVGLAGKSPLYVRCQDAFSDWSPWRELYHTGNLLGTVSQAAGVPTGAVIQSGDNGSGRWVRFANGTQIVEHQILLENLDINSAYGSLYASADQTYTWPVQFASGDTPFVSLVKASGVGANAGVFGFEIMTGSLVVGMTYKVISSASKTGLAQLPIRVFAIGRWFIL